MGTEYRGSDVGSQFKQGIWTKFDKQCPLTGNDPQETDSIVIPLPETGQS